MLKLDNLQDALLRFGENVVKDSKSNLSSSDKVVSGKLLNSLSVGKVKLTKRSMELNINMENYGAFIDKGVSGVKKKYDTPYSYTNKMPPPSALDGWIVRRGIAPRNSKGQFQTRKSVQFAISKSIFNNGIKPSHFLSDAVKKNITTVPMQLRDAFALDVKSTVDFIIKSNFKNK
jgi:hypothetical protein